MMDIRKLNRDDDTILLINQRYYVEALSMILSREDSTNIEFFGILEKVGLILHGLSEDDVLNLNDIKCREILHHIAVMVKFLAPMMEQFESSIDNNIDIEG